MKAGRPQALYHRNVNVQLGGIIKDRCQEDSHIHHSAEKLINFLCKTLYILPSLSVLSVNQEHNPIFDCQNDPNFSICSFNIHRLLFVYSPSHIPRTQDLSLGRSLAAVQLENVGLRAILTTLYVFSPGASKPGDKPRLSNV